MDRRAARRRHGHLADAPHLMVEGRPLRRRNGTIHRARARLGHSHLTDRQALKLRHDVRQALAEYWRTQGELEHSSVVAYQDLARRLALLDAPEHLVRRSMAAAMQEADHWTRCFDLAGRYLGQSLRPGRLRRPVRLPRSRTAELVALAVETLRDGLLNEGYAARLAAAKAERATDQRVHETLTIIAADEFDHASLSRDVLDWCLLAGGRPVFDMLNHLVTNMPVRARSVTLPAGLESHTLGDHGLFDADPDGAMFAALLTDVRDELAVRLQAHRLADAA
jgi:hypothetical protein